MEDTFTSYKIIEQIEKGGINKMSDHYYTQEPTSESNPESFDATLKGYKLTFKTDSGVFSKDRIDHGSQVLLDAIDLAEFPEGDVLDVGCGYGAIGLTLAKEAQERTIQMVDVNERALALATENAKQNKIKNVRIYSSSLYESVEETEFAGVVSNPPIRAGKKVVHAVLEEAWNVLKPGGMLTVVIRKKQGAPSAKKKMEEVFGNVKRLTQDKGYWILQSEK